MTKPPRQSESDVNVSQRRKAWADRNTGKKTAELVARDAAVFLHQSVSTPCLSAAVKARGIYLEDADGRRIMDFHGNNVHHIGYGHTRLIDAIKSQLDNLAFAPRRYTCAPAVELAEKLREITPGNLGKVLFATGGSDAIEMALKIARAKTGRFKTLSFWDSFHGAGFGASSIGGEQLFRGPAIGPLLAGAEHIAPFACFNCPYGHDVMQNGQPDLEQCHMACAKMLAYVLEKEGDVAAVIAEPARAVPYLPPPGFWEQVRAACDAHGTLLIFDEIPTGLGKTGRMFACEHDDIVPDILVLGKALGGGILPISAVVCQPELDIAGDYAFGHYTHEKNPVTARAALTTIEIIEQEGLVANAARIGAYALERLIDMQKRHPVIGDVRGRGFLIGIELVTGVKEKRQADDIAEAVLYRALELGLGFKISMGNILTLTPPLITARGEMDQALDIIEKCLNEAESGII